MTCPECHGGGLIGRDCYGCNGLGTSPSGLYACGVCDGAGTLSEGCETCHGTGEITQSGAGQGRE